MRTTLTINDALLRQLRQKALDSGKPFKQVVNETLRAGLEKPTAAARPRYVCPTFSTGPLTPGSTSPGPGPTGLVRGQRHHQHGLHRARIPIGERLCRVIQRPVPR